MYRNKQSLVIEHIYGDDIENYGSFILVETDSKRAFCTAEVEFEFTT